MENGKNFSYAFLRKEKKDHGDKGMVSGKLKKDKPILLVDDVLTAGTAVADALRILNRLGLRASALLIAFDRMECPDKKDSRTTANMLESKFGLRVHRLATAEDLLKTAGNKEKRLIKEHLARYGSAENL